MWATVLCRRKLCSSNRVQAGSGLVVAAAERGSVLLERTIPPPPRRYPEKWPQLTTELLDCIKTQKQDVMQGALNILVQVTKKFK